MRIESEGRLREIIGHPLPSTETKKIPNLFVTARFGETRPRAREDQHDGGLFADNPRKSTAGKFLLGVIRTPDDPPFFCFAYPRFSSYSLISYLRLYKFYWTTNFLCGLFTSLGSQLSLPMRCCSPLGLPR